MTNISKRSVLYAPPGRYAKENTVRFILFLCAFLAVLMTALTTGLFVVGSAPFFEKVPLADFLLGTDWSPLITPESYGALPLITGTLAVTFIALIVALPLGLLSAIYLSEFASHRVRKFVKPVLEVLAGIPTVVFGYFALLYLTPLLRETFFPEIQFWNVLSAGLVLGFAILPLVSSLSEDVIYAVPQSLRDGALALGATKYETIWRVVLPAALSGISAAFILSLSRAIGETMIVAIAAGRTPSWPPELLKPVETITVHMVNIGTGDAEAGDFIWATIFSTGLLLFVTTLILNVISYFVVKRFREKFE
jgi:phosphate transport system permease protein